MRANRYRPPRASYDPLQRLEKRDLVQRIRTLEQELEAERQRRGGLAYDQQAMRAKMFRLETEIILLQPARGEAVATSAQDRQAICAQHEHRRPGRERE